jgi:hypothetical protein
MSRRREHRLDEALEEYYAEREYGQVPEPARRQRSLAIPFLLGLVTVGTLVGLAIALWRWRPQLQEMLEARGISASWLESTEQLLSPQPSPNPSLQWQARVADTGGMGLYLRAQPGVASPVLGTLPEGTVTELLEGPVEIDGHTWWKVTHEGKEGWCAGEWLEITPGGD